MADLTECPVCFDEYVDPKSLPCSHTMCYKCLLTLAKAPTLLCPICKVEHRVPDRGVKAFPENSYVIQCIAYKNDNQQLKQLLREKYESVTDVESAETLPELLCDIHDKELTLYCDNQSCGHFICDQCSLSQHREHNFINAAQTVIDITKSVTEQRNCVKTIEKELERIVTSYVLAEKRIKSQSSLAINQVEQLERHAISLIRKGAENITSEINMLQTMEEANVRQSSETVKDKLEEAQYLHSDLVNTLKEKPSISGDIASKVRSLSAATEQLASTTWLGFPKKYQVPQFKSDHIIDEDVLLKSVFGAKKVVTINENIPVTTGLGQKPVFTPVSSLSAVLNERPDVWKLKLSVEKTWPTSIDLFITFVSRLSVSQLSDECAVSFRNDAGAFGVKSFSYNGALKWVHVLGIGDDYWVSGVCYANIEAKEYILVAQARKSCICTLDPERKGKLVKVYHGSPSQPAAMCVSASFLLVVDFYTKDDIHIIEIKSLNFKHTGRIINTGLYDWVWDMCMVKHGRQEYLALTCEEEMACYDYSGSGKMLWRMSAHDLSLEVDDSILCDIASDNEGHIFLSDKQNQRIIAMNSDGSNVRTLRMNTGEVWRLRWIPGKNKLIALHLHAIATEKLVHRALAQQLQQQASFHITLYEINKTDGPPTGYIACNNPNKKQRLFDVHSWTLKCIKSHYDADKCGAEGCNKQGTKKCQACKIASYCSKECQRNDWLAKHKPHCLKVQAIETEIKDHGEEKKAE